MAENLLSLRNPVFISYLFYSAVLLLKLFLVLPMITYYRIKYKVFPSEEDYHVDPKSGKKMKQQTHPDVERLRRIHQNDLENIPIFVILGLLYVLTNPPYSTAIKVFRLFFVARLVHTLVYFFALHKPRGMSWLVGMFCNLYLAVKVLQASRFFY